MCNIHKIKEHAQVKAILVFMVKSVSSCFLIDYIYTIHAIVVKNFSYIHQYIDQAGLKMLIEMIH